MPIIVYPEVCVLFTLRPLGAAVREPPFSAEGAIENGQICSV